MSDFSRREFIKKSILLSLGASYIISCDDNDMIESINESDSNNNKKVIIIGAGISGLVAGYDLTIGGYDVTILEA